MDAFGGIKNKHMSYYRNCCMHLCSSFWLFTKKSHMKKDVLTCLFIFGFLLNIAAQSSQKEKTYLFEKFTAGKVLMKDGTTINASLNYDCINKEMNYLENNERMILLGLEMIDTVYIINRKFIPHKTFFLEVIPVGNSELYVSWKTKVANKGKEGAMGMVSHSGTVETLDVLRIQNKGVDNANYYIYNFAPENTYYLSLNNQLKKFNNSKSLLKLFPEKKDKIKTYLKENEVSFSNLEAVISLIDFIIK